MRLLVVDLLAEREAFGRVGVGEIVHHFSPNNVFLWSPHTQDRLDYGFGTVVEHPVDADAIVITGSRRNVTMWEDWMDDVVDLIRATTVPLYGRRSRRRATFLHRLRRSNNSAPDSGTSR